MAPTPLSTCYVAPEIEYTPNHKLNHLAMPGWSYKLNSWFLRKSTRQSSSIDDIMSLVYVCVCGPRMSGRLLWRIGKPSWCVPMQTHLSPMILNKHAKCRATEVPSLELALGMVSLIYATTWLIWLCTIATLCSFYIRSHYVFLKLSWKFLLQAKIRSCTMIIIVLVWQL